jgi:hypothetical protein
VPPFAPVTRRRLIDCLQAAGLDGPYPGGKHEYMRRGRRKIPLPNPHAGDVSRRMLTTLLRQTGISREAWERLDC